jgi:ssDNA-binding replication factor A large subunit
MINMPYEDIIKKIKAGSSISDDDLNSRIKKKMDQLSGLISKEGAAYIVANDLGVKLIQAEGMVKLDSLYAGQRNIETAGIVTRIFDLIEFEKEDRKGKVRSLILADDTGQARITAWHDQTALLDKVKEGDTIKVVNGFVRNNQGQNEVHLNDRSKIVKNPEGITIKNVKVMQKAEFSRKKISELQENEQNIEVFGTVVQVFDPRYFEQCPQCRKKPSLAEGEYVCAEHGKITPVYGYVTNIVLDDGSDSIRAVMFREQMQQLFGKTDQELLGYRSNIEKFEELKTALLGEQVVVAGRVVRNDMFDRLELRASKVMTDIDPEKEIAKLKADSAKKEPVQGDVPKKDEKEELADTSGTDAEDNDSTENEVEKEETSPSVPVKADADDSAIGEKAGEEAESAPSEPTMQTSAGTEPAKEEKPAVGSMENKSDDDSPVEKEDEDVDGPEEEKEKLPSIDDL